MKKHRVPLIQHNNYYVYVVIIPSKCALCKLSNFK